MSNSYELDNLVNSKFRLQEASFEAVLVERMSTIVAVLQDLSSRITFLETNNISQPSQVESLEQELSYTNSKVESLQMLVDSVSALLDNCDWCGQGQLGTAK